MNEPPLLRNHRNPRQCCKGHLMAVICAYCGGAHVWWDCRKKPDGWKPPKPSRADAKEASQDQHAPATAEIQPLSGGDKAARTGDEVGRVGSIPARSTNESKRGRGRPRSIEDMRAYKAQKQREYRAKSKPDA